MQAKNRDVYRLLGIFSHAAKDRWTYVQTAEEFKRQGIVLVEHGVLPGSAVRYVWQCGAEFSRNRPGGRTPLVPAQPDLSAIKRASAKLVKGDFDYLKFVAELAVAGVIRFDTDVQKGEVRFYGAKAGKANGKPLHTQRLALKDGERLAHKNKKRLHAFFMKAGAEGWENADVYAGAAKLGVASYIYFLDTAQNRITWTDGTTWSVTSEHGIKPVKRIAAAFEPQSIPEFVKAFDAGALPYQDYMNELGEVGVQSFVTDLANKKLVFYAKDGKATKEVKLKF